MPLRQARRKALRRRAVGRNVLRKEGADKVTGVARYIDDLAFPGMLYGRTVRSARYDVKRGLAARLCAA